VSDGHAGLPRVLRGLVPDELGQVFRLQAFRAAHPEVIVGDGGFGTWQARILGFAERSLCKHCADLGFYVENMYATSAVSLSVTAAHRHQR